jgi:hypothetical protein
MLFRSFDEVPVAEVFDQRPVRLPFGDVGEIERSAGREGTECELDQHHRRPFVEIVEEAAGEDQIERSPFQAASERERISLSEVALLSNGLQCLAGKADDVSVDVIQPELAGERGAHIEDQAQVGKLPQAIEATRDRAGLARNVRISRAA